MSTVLQKNLAKNIVKNLTRKKPLNKGELVVMSGYSKTTATQQIPAVFEQKGVKEELAILGFDEESAKKVVSEILHNEKVDPGNRLRAAQEVFKVMGSYAPEKSQALNVNFEARLEDKSEIEALRVEYEEKLKNKLLG